MFACVARGALLSGAAAVCLIASPVSAQQVGPAPGDTLDPSSPLAPLPDLGVAWPDLGDSPDASDAAPTDRPGTALAEMQERRYDFHVEGLEGIDDSLLRERFGELSTLDANDDEPANAAQIDRRAREDAATLVTLLRGQGYYGAAVLPRIAAGGDRISVVLEAEPGPRYRLSAVELPGLDAEEAEAADLRRSLGLSADDPADADAIAAAVERLRVRAGATGFAFARVGAPELVVDHATRTAILQVPVETGGARRFGQIRAVSNGVFGADHVAEIARFAPGDPYRAAEVEDLRRAILQTGLVSSVRIAPLMGETPDTVDLSVALEPAPPRTIAGELGYGTGEGVRAEVSWTHRNLFPPEGALTLRGVLGTREQQGTVLFRRSNFHGRDRVLTGQFAVAHVERDAYDANTYSLAASLERQTNIFFQKTWTWSIGGELVASDERDVIAATGQPRRRTYLVGAVPTTLNYDGSDDLLDPRTGFRLGGRVSPELSLVGQAFGYVRAQLDASGYQPVGDDVVLAGRVRLGTIFGAPRDAIAPSRRFYAGGGASVRGYSYQAIGPRDPDNDPVGGRSLAEFSIEARVKAFGNFGFVPFLDGGNIYTDFLPDLSRFRFGTGLGVRYYSSFGPIRLDVGTPLNPRRGDPRVTVYVSLGQAF